jgi:hypothetical protein
MAVPNMKQQVVEADSGFSRTGKQEEQLEARGANNCNDPRDP